LIIISFLFQYKTSFSQLFPRFSIAGGPTIGWQYNETDDLNAEVRKIGVPEFPKDGFLTLGGGGFIELPIKGLTWLRLGGSGTGFTSKRQIKSEGIKNVTETVYYSYGAGGVSFEYVKHFGKIIELTFGALLSTGKLNIELYQNNSGFGNWNTIFGEIGGSTQNISRKLSVRFYSAQPQIGFGVFVTSFMYAKLNAGYLFSANNDWKVDDNIPVTNAPTGIKADGFNVNFGINLGLFTR